MYVNVMNSNISDKTSIYMLWYNLKIRDTTPRPAPTPSSCTYTLLFLGLEPTSLHIREHVKKIALADA